MLKYWKDATPIQDATVPLEDNGQDQDCGDFRDRKLSRTFSLSYTCITMTGYKGFECGYLIQMLYYTEVAV